MQQLENAKQMTNFIPQDLEGNSNMFQYNVMYFGALHVGNSREEKPLQGMYMYRCTTIICKTMIIKIVCLSYHLKNCLAKESASLNMACSEESLKHSELALLEAKLSCRDDPVISEWMCPRSGGVADWGKEVLFGGNFSIIQTKIDPA